MTILSVTDILVADETPNPRHPTLRANPPPREIRHTIRIGSRDVCYTGAEPSQIEVEAWLLEKQTEEGRIEQFNSSIRNFVFGGQTLASLKTMTNVEFDVWWDANIDTFAKAMTVLKLLTRAAIRRML